MQRFRYRVGFVLLPVALGACHGITTQRGADIPLALQPPVLENNVDDADIATFAMSDYCGSLGLKSQDGLVSSLRIPAYSSAQPPQIIAVDPKAVAPYSALLTNDAAVTAKVAYGPATGGASVTTNDRWQITDADIAHCQGYVFDASLIEKAKQNLNSIVIKPADTLVVITSARSKSRTTAFLKSITVDEQGAATPIVNIGGNNFSKTDVSGVVHFVKVTVFEITRSTPTSPGSTPAVMTPVPTNQKPQAITEVPAATNEKATLPSSNSSVVQALKRATALSQRPNATVVPGDAFADKVKGFGNPETVRLQ
jgi:hypothetical protein